MPDISPQSFSVYPLRSTSSALAVSCVGAPPPSSLLLSAVPSISPPHFLLPSCPQSTYQWTPHSLPVFRLSGKCVSVTPRIESLYRFISPACCSNLPNPRSVQTFQCPKPVCFSSTEYPTPHRTAPGSLCWCLSLPRTR